MPYSKTCDTFRASDHAAVGTGLGSPSLVGLDVTCSVPAGFVCEHVTEHRPAGIRDGLRHLRLLELGSVHIADDDKLVFAGDLGCRLMKMVTPGVGDLGVDSLDPTFITGALRDGKFTFVSPIVPQGRDRSAITTGRDGLESKVDSDLAIPSPEIVGDLALKGDVPSPTGVLSEAPRLELAFNVARFPEVEFALEIDDVRAINLQCTRDKRYPSERTIGTSTCAKSRASFFRITRYGKLPADSLHGIGVNSEISSGSGTQIDQVKSARPFGDTASLPSGLGLALRLTAEVPDEINSPRMASESSSSRRVFHAIFECDEHRFLYHQVQSHSTKKEEG